MPPLDDKTAFPSDDVRDAIVGVRTDVGAARGLPNECYVSNEMFEIEKKRVLFANWSGVGFAHRVPEHGDAIPIDFLGMPLLMLRDKQGDVRVYQNTCRHRGMILVDAPRKIEGAIRCPYHSWCYALDGRLISTPHVGGPGQNLHPALDRNDLGLFEIRSHVWLGVVFVNISGDAPDFTEANADMIMRWREFEKPLHFGGETSMFSLNVKANWKLIVENNGESYHLPWVHPGLNSYSRLEDHYNISEYGKYCGQGTLVYRPQLSEDNKRFPDFADLSEKWDSGAEYLNAFPNAMLGVHRDHIFAFILMPDGPCNTTEHISIFYANEEACSEAYRTLREAHTAAWKEVFLEDMGVVEGMQRGRSGVKFDGGRFSPAMDEPTHVFHDWIASRLL